MPRLDSKKPHRKHEQIDKVRIEDYELEGTIPEVIERLQAKLKTAEDLGYSDVKMEVGNLLGYSGEMELSVFLTGSRLETDREVADRRERAKMIRERKKEEAALKEVKEKELYLKLKEKYDK